MRTLRLGTRGSALARWQAEWVAAQLRSEGIAVSLVPITTQGDRQQTGPVETIGGQGIFTKELQRALLDDQIDLAVHSLKDLPTDPVPGLGLGAVPERAPCGDVLITRRAPSFAELPRGALIGTGSTRRRSQLRHARPDLRMADVRGNVDTRLRKLDDGQYDALVLAEAGLLRLGLIERVTQVLPKELILPAVGQGALGIEIRAADDELRQLLAPLDHCETHQAVIAERAMLAALRGGCLAPVGAWGRIESGRLRLSGVVLSVDGRRRIAAEVSDEPASAAEIGRRVAGMLLEQGAAELIAAARSSPDPP
ncbi:MAG TPA: hydroxymethylbilane synthase [Pirellulales bacterium]|nr:hydroxymethylbilane synthase [Pirellulales bacterium]